MLKTVFLKRILDTADAVKEEFGGQSLCASHIAVAVADFCRGKYTGFSLSDETVHPVRFEEERLRYLFAKTVRMSSYFRMRLSQNFKRGIVEKEFDLSVCEKTAASHGFEVLATDVVFLCALKEIDELYRSAVVVDMSDDCISVLLEDTDKNICDYVIENIAGLCGELKRKSDEAVALRDKKPAEKFAEPEDLSAMFFEKIEKHFCDNVVTLRFKRFFGDSDLKLSIHKVDGVYYINDNGCSIKHLLKMAENKEKAERALKRVCDRCWIDNGKVTGSFIGVSRFLYYLQRLVFVAHADLYYTKAEKPLYCKETGYVYLNMDKAEPICEAEFLDEMKKGINFCYDENAGLYCWFDTKYSLSSGRASFLIETLKDRFVRISDRKKGRIEGEIFEEFYWSNEDIAPYGKFVKKIASRFGAEFDGRDIYLTDREESLFFALVRFFNLAVLLSEFGHDIALPKIR